MKVFFSQWNNEVSLFNSAKKTQVIKGVFYAWLNNKNICLFNFARKTPNSHLSNKRGVTLIDFEKKFHPPRTFPPSMFIDFLDFFHPPLHVYCIYVLVFSKKFHPPRLFQPQRLLILQLLHSLHVYSNLHGYQRDESSFKMVFFCYLQIDQKKRQFCKYFCRSLQIEVK